MTRSYANPLAAIAAIVLTLTSIGTIVTVPEAQAHADAPAAMLSQPVAELA